MLELKEYMGCGNCEKCNANFDCDSHKVPVFITFKREEKWDNWGRMVTAFRKDETVQGYAVIDDNKVYCATAESTIYKGITDYVSLDRVEIEYAN